MSDRSLYIGNLNVSCVSRRTLYELLVLCGPISRLYVHTEEDAAGGKGGDDARVTSVKETTYALCDYDIPQSCDYALSVLDGVMLWGRPIRLRRRQADASGRKVFVGNLHPLVTTSILTATICTLGITDFTECNVVRDAATGHPRGFGFIHFDEEAEAENAVSVLAAVCLFHQPIRASLSSQPSYNITA